MDQGCEKMTQSAPYPHALKILVDRLRYKSGWDFYLSDIDRGQGSRGLTLLIKIATPDSYSDSDRRIHVSHYMPVPPAAYDERSWRSWLFSQILLVERHEAMEFFRLKSSSDEYDRPYAPSHGPGNDPYLVREIGTELDQKTKFTGEISD